MPNFFFRFWAVLVGTEVYNILRRTKNGLKKKIGKWRPENHPRCIFVTGLSERANPADALELASSYISGQHASSPEGAADLTDVRQRRDTAALQNGSCNA